MVDVGRAVVVVVVDKASIEWVLSGHAAAAAAAAAVPARRDIAGILVVKAVAEVGRRVLAGMEAVAVEQVGLVARLGPPRMPTPWCRQDP